MLKQCCISVAPGFRCLHEKVWLRNPGHQSPAASTCFEMSSIPKIIIQSASPLLFIVIPECIKKKSPRIMIQKLRIASLGQVGCVKESDVMKNLCLTDQRWIFQYRAIASRFNFWLTMPLAVRSTCHVWSSARIQQIWKKCD